jgi:hypothetical protein
MTSLTACISYEDPLISTLILESLSSVIPSLTHVTNPSTANLQWSTYELLNFDHLLHHPRTTLCNSYIFRKALIRKHFLANTVAQWLAKNPASILSRSVPRTFLLECDFAEYLDEALNESFELRDAVMGNEGRGGGERSWFILKPSMADRGQGIRLFSTMKELEEIFEEFEAQEEEEEEEEEKENIRGQGSRDTGVIANQLRHFVIQEYIPNPLLLTSPSPPRKFHLRTYIVSMGAIKVYVWSEILALFASKTYSPPSRIADLSAHLTNTCLQVGEENSGNVVRFWELPLQEGVLRGIWRDICDVTGEVFMAAAQGQQMHFQVLVPP